MEIQHEALALPQHARERSQFGASLGSGEALLVHADEFPEGALRSVASSVGRLEREGLPGVACLQRVDDVCVASIQSFGDLADRGLARELTLEPAVCARDGQGELLETSRGERSTNGRGSGA